MPNMNKTWYEILKIPRDATQEEIEEAFKERKQDARYDPTLKREIVEKAYQTLRDQERREKYDIRLEMAESDGKETTGGGETVSDAGATKRQKILIAVLAILVVFSIWYYVSNHGYKWETHDKGTVLVHKDTGEKFGLITEYDSSHRFNEDTTLPAYKIKLQKNDKSKWYPKQEVNFRYEPR